MKTQSPLLLLCLACVRACAQVPFYNQTIFQEAAPDATNVIDFQEFNLGSGQGTGFMPAFTELEFVVFHTNANFRQEVIDGLNVGQPNNSVYTTLAANLNLTIADITFGRGVLAVGFDLKDTGNASSTGGAEQTFFATFFSCSTNLGMFPIVAPAGGTTFQFFGMTSTNPITEIQFSSVEGTPNLNLVLDNFLVASRPPVPPTALQFQRTSDGLVLSWPGCGFTLQTATAITGPFAGLPGATSPYTNSFAGPAKFFRLKTN